MAAASTLSALSDLFKEIYPKGVPQNLALRKCNTLRKMKKADDLYGGADDYVVPVRYGNPQGRSADFATAQSNATSGKQKAFRLSRKSDYHVVTLSAEAIYAAEKDVGAFVRTKKIEIDGMLDQLGQSLSHALFRSGSGSIGQRASISSETITLSNPKDARNFAEGMVIVANDTDNATSVRSGQATVESVDYSAGTVTLVAGGAAAITGFANNDYLFVEGDPGAKITGFEGWIPTTVTASESFFGVDRSVNRVLLAGNVLDAASEGLSIEEAILQMSEDIEDIGGEPDVAIMSHANFNTLAKSLGTKVEYEGGGTADVGFGSFRFHTSGRVLTVMADRFCQSDRIWVLQMDTWTLHHMKELPHLVEDDGLVALRMPSDDGVEVRARYWAQLGCEAPGWNGKIII